MKRILQTKNFIEMKRILQIVALISEIIWLYLQLIIWKSGILKPFFWIRLQVKILPRLFKIAVLKYRVKKLTNVSSKQ